jgi:type IV secretory pathway VirB9-like protein
VFPEVRRIKEIGVKVPASNEKLNDYVCSKKRSNNMIINKQVFQHHEESVNNKRYPKQHCPLIKVEWEI